MNARIARLRAQIAADRRALDRRLDEADAVDPAVNADTSAHFAMAAHHAYSALESVLERVARELEGGVAVGTGWHRELLDGAFLEIPSLRPAILSPSLAAPLHDLRGFRRFIRHAYDADMDVDLLTAIRDRLRAMRPELDRDLDRLDVFLEGVAGA